jgi:hypothetical protein
MQDKDVKVGDDLLLAVEILQLVGSSSVALNAESQ